MKYTPTPGPHPGRQWMPSNGTEGACFHSDWCAKCARDKVMNGEVDQDHADESDYCPILMASYTTNEGPVEWREIQNGDGADPFRADYVCTGFIDKDDPVPPERCPNTPDMFPEEPRP